MSSSSTSTSKAKAVPAEPEQAEPEQTRYRVRIAFEGMRVDDEFSMVGTDPYVLGLLGAGLIEEASPPAGATRRVGPTPAGDDTSRGDRALQERHVASDVPPDTSSLPVDATP